jgi:hypothetical protein
MRMVITREEAYDMEDAHSQGLHDELPREGCPTCSRRETSSYPTAAEVASKSAQPRQRGLTVTYSSAAPYIREALMRAVSVKLAAKTQRDRARHVGEMQGLVSALKILLRSPEGKDSEVGYPDYHGANEGRVLAEIERFVGGAHEMIELGFKAT